MGGCLLGVVNLGALDDVAATGGLEIMYTVILAPQRVAGALRRRGGLVDVVRRPSRNDNSSNAGAVGSASEPGLDGTGDEGTGPTWPTGVLACGMMRVTLR